MNVEVLKNRKLLTSTFLDRPARHREPLRRCGRVFDIQSGGYLILTHAIEWASRYENRNE
jgi:hypothetical protein